MACRITDSKAQQRLGSSVHGSSHVRESRAFVEFMRSQTIPKKEILVSFNVVSLFTCIPTDLAIQVAHRKLESDASLPERTSLGVNDITDLLSLCLDATFLSFRGKMYQEVHGIAMGSPVSVVVANLVMEDIEERALSTFHPPTHFWKCYFDDTCAALPLDQILPFLDHLNSIEPCVQFTVEEESDGRLAFLDVQLSRNDDGTVCTSVYRKATHTNQYLAFESHHPIAHKVAVVKTLMSRAEALSSSGVERAQEEKEVTGALKENGYPSSFVYKHSCSGRPRPDREEQRPKTTLTLPYISNLSEAIRRVLTPLDIQVVFRPLMTLRQLLVHPKDRVPMDEQKGVDYSISCTECPKVYIGQTGRSLKHRLKEHRRALRNGDMAASALAEHALTAGHDVDLSKAEVLDSNPYTATWCMLESWHIQRNENRVNRERGTFLRCTRHSWTKAYHS